MMPTLLARLSCEPLVKGSQIAKWDWMHWESFNSNLTRHITKYTGPFIS